MKKLLVLFYLMSACSVVFAQDKNAEAKVHYINAEDFYNKGTLEDFDNCVIELEKAENALSGTNSKILYLKIKAMSYSAITYKDGYYFYDLTTSFEKFFKLADINNYPENKYAEIVNIQDTLHLAHHHFRSSKDSINRSKWRQSDSALYFRGKSYLGKQNEFALKCFLKSAQKGYSKAYAEMGDYYNSYAVKIIIRNPTANDSIHSAYRKAIVWYKKLIDAGILYEKNYSGDTVKSYLFEIGSLSYFATDYGDAIKYLSLAAQNNRVEAFYDLGEIYFNGLGVDIDYKKALDYYLKSALSINDDRRRAMQKVSDIYKDGLGVKRDKAQAKEWAQKARE